jgi:branched-chain amino acid aminotransferase
MANACVDGRILPAAEATISVLDEGLIRGDGAFEVMRLYGGRPFALEDHLRRLQGSASGLKLEIDLSAVRADIEALLVTAEPDDADGAIRVMVTRGGRRISFFEPLEDFSDALTLATVTYAPTRILDGIKSLSYASNKLASRLAKEQGADEALLVTPHGRVLEAPTSAFFWVGGGELRTPPLSDHVLDSITRRRLMAALDAVEHVTPLDDLFGAEEAFLASTTREVQAVQAIDGRPLPEAPGRRTRDAQAAFKRVIADELGP